jgi:hypothetical protein
MRSEAIIRLAGMLGAIKINARRTYVQIPCPLASKTHQNGTDKHPSLSILVKDVERSGWKCHSCGAKGLLNDLITHWAVINRKDPTEPYALIKKEEEGLEALCTRVDHRLVDDKWNAPSFVSDGVDFEVFEEKELDAFERSVPQWAIDRGLTLETCKEWNLRYDPEWKDPETGENWPRLVIPVRRRDGKLVGLVGRALDHDCPNKYWAYWHWNKSNYIYGQDRVPKDAKAIIVVEGMFDTMKLWEYGLPVGGVIGSEPSERQAQMLMEYGKVLLALDRDKAGEKGTDWLIQRLRNRVPLFSVPFPDGKIDPKQFTFEEAWEGYKNARRIL